MAEKYCVFYKPQTILFFLEDNAELPKLRKHC